MLIKGDVKMSRQNQAQIQGNTVRSLNSGQALEALPIKKLSNQARKNREKAYHMSAGYVIFLSVALVAAGLILTGYIKLQCDITNSIKNIAKLESTLNVMTMDNDEVYNRILASVNLEEIRKIATQELGMQYASEGQIVKITGEDSDYVRQYMDLPEITP